MQRAPHAAIRQSQATGSPPCFHAQRWAMQYDAAGNTLDVGAATTPKASATTASQSAPHAASRQSPAAHSPPCFHAGPCNATPQATLWMLVQPPRPAAQRCTLVAHSTSDTVSHNMQHVTQCNIAHPAGVTQEAHAAHTSMHTLDASRRAVLQPTRQLLIRPPCPGAQRQHTARSCAE